jgi:hypothetical protein
MKLKDLLKKPEEKDYDKKELDKGINVEKEHINPKAPKKIAKKIQTNIAKNHLDEIPDYYDKLEKMERET